MKAWLSAAAAVVPLLAAAAALSVEALATSATNDGARTTAAATSERILRTSRDYRLLEVVPHDPSSFTQGLTYFDGHLYEGTGLEHQSALLRHDPSGGMRTLDRVPVEPSHLFGEGISAYHVWRTDGETGRRFKEHRLVQLTWKNKVGKIYSLPEMEVLKEFTYETVTGEGWGITFVPHRNEFYVSDGSDNLIVWDAETLAEKRRIAVTFDRGDGVDSSVRWVNELEFVDFATSQMDENDGPCDDEDGACYDKPFTPMMRILANIWYQDVLVSIDPVSGKVVRVYDMTDIFPKQERLKAGSDCLNGISVTGTRSEEGEGLEVWVTGKLWPNMYRIQLID